jgi:Patatin-like phospholipase
LGVVMAGAISAGAYTAGVMDFIFEALDAYENAKTKPGWRGPMHDVRVPVLAGASAGGMTSAICALHAFHKLKHIWPGTEVPAKPLNRLYSSWVTDNSIDDLLATTDLAADKGLKSAFCSDALDRLVNDAFILDPEITPKNWIGRGANRSLRIMLTLTNLRGVPYSFRLFGSESNERYGMLNHADYLDFTIGVSPSAQAGSQPLDITNTATADWDTYRTAALATGAFPIGSPPRVIERRASDYSVGGQVGYEDLTSGRFVPIAPDDDFQVDKTPYRFVSVDGGTINNEPLELARRYLAGAAGHNERDGDKANRAVLLVAPFPNLQRTPPEDLGGGVLHILPKLFSSLVRQARFKPEELRMAANDKIFSRFMISPVRAASGNQAASKLPIASGAMDGFAGLLHESFRRHDYLLGRRNAQAFLRWNFALPETNALFADLEIDADVWHVRDLEQEQGSIAPEQDRVLSKKKFATTVNSEPDCFGYPIIPLPEKLCEPIEIGEADRPRPKDVDRARLDAKIHERVARVISTLVEVDFAPEIASRLGIWTTPAKWGARSVGTAIVYRHARAAVDQALEEISAAFRT